VAASEAAQWPARVNDAWSADAGLTVSLSTTPIQLTFESGAE